MIVSVRCGCCGCYKCMVCCEFCGLSASGFTFCGSTTNLFYQFQPSYLLSIKIFLLLITQCFRLLNDKCVCVRSKGEMFSYEYFACYGKFEEVIRYGISAHLTPSIVPWTLVGVAGIPYSAFFITFMLFICE